MAEPTPSDNQTSRSESSRPDGVVQDAPSSVTSDKQGPLVFRLVPPLPATNLQRRAADARRRRLRWSEGSPPGVYWNGDVDPYHRFLVKGIGRNDGAHVDPSDPVGPQGISTNTTADDPDSDAEDLSESEGADSNYSSPPLTPPPEFPHISRTTKRRATLSNRSHGPPFGRLAEVSLDALEDELTLKRQGYMLELIISQSPGEFVGGTHDALFKMHIDTATNLTWVLGDQYRQAIAEYDGHNNITQIVLDQWDTLPEGHSVLAPNLVPWDENNAREILRPPFDRPFVSYHDDGLVVVEQLPRSQARQFIVDHLFNWNVHRWSERMRFPAYRWTVANAVDEDTADDPTNGSLALGLCRIQYINSSTSTDPPERDIWSVLGSRAIPLSSLDPDGAGHTLFYGMRPTYADRQAAPSWIAFNQWPSDPVDWSERIPVHPEADGTWDKWNVEVIRMDFHEIRPASDTEGYERILLCSIDLTQNGRGAMFYLDTGSSTSDFPPAAIHALMDMIRTVVATTGANSQLGGDADFHFHIPNAFGALDVEIDFIFRGEGNTTVAVTGPDIPFLFQDAAGGALVFLTPQNGPNILGLNFFQTMFIAMHRPENPNEVPWVKLAPQPNFGETIPHLPPRID